MELTVLRRARTIAEHVVVARIVDHARDGPAEIVHVANDEAAAVDRKTVHRVGAEIHVIEQARVGIGRGRVHQDAEPAIQPAGIEGIEPRVRLRRRVDSRSHERPRLLGEKPFGHEQHGLPALETRQPVHQRDQHLNRLVRSSLRLRAQIRRLDVDRRFDEVDARFRILVQRASNDDGPHHLIVAGSDPHGFDLGHPRELAFLEQPRVLLGARLRALHRLDELLAVARQPVVHHASVADDAAEIAAVHERLLEQRERRLLRPFESAWRHVIAVEHDDERSPRRRRLRQR